MARKLDLLQLGEPEAYRLGIDVQRVKLSIIFTSASAVGASGSVGRGANRGKTRLGYNFQGSGV